MKKLSFLLTLSLIITGQWIAAQTFNQPAAKPDDKSFRQIMEPAVSYTGKLVRTTPRLDQIDKTTMYGKPLVVTRNKDGIIGIGRRLEETEEKIEKKWQNSSSSRITEAIQKSNTIIPTIAGSSIVANFDGQLSPGLSPTDNNIAAGPNHVIQIVNDVSGSAFTIYNKSGAVVQPRTVLATITGFPGFGDPVVLYDQLADRWVLMEFGPNTLPIHTLNIAVSVTGNPTGAWKIYQYQDITFFIDYEKMSVWHNGYYLTSNDFNNAGTAYLGSSVYSMDRAAMIAGAPTATMIRTRLNDAGNNYYNMGTIGLEGMTTSTQNGLFAFPIGPTTLNLFEVTPNFTAGTQTIGPLIPLTIASYATPPAAVPQQGGGTAQTLGERMMFKLNYRNNSGTESIVMTHTVGNGALAAVRWYELRRVASNWTVFQQGTITGSDGNSRFMGGISMDGCGNIALMYDVSGAAANPSIRYTGRNASDPLGTMPLAEQTIINGTSAHTGNARWGDYNTTVQDYTQALVPNNGSFWSTSQYGNQLTRIANYTLTGGCAVGSACTINLSSGSNVQTVCINSPIANITYTTTGATGATFTGLPAGVTGIWSNNVVTISGTPSVSGPFNYTVTLLGCTNSTTATGTITVQVNTITLTSASGGITFTGEIVAGDPTTGLRPFRDGVPKTCAVPGACASGIAGTFHYQILSWTNPSTLPLCVDAVYSATNANFSFIAAFNGTVDLTNLCTNWIADPGSSATVGTPILWSFTAPGGATVKFLVTDVGALPAGYELGLNNLPGGTEDQTICKGTGITNITYATTGATGANFSGLPAGVIGTWASNVVTISGIPTVSGVFNYTVTLTGGCGIVTRTGKITVNPIPDAVATPSSQTITSGTAITPIVLTGGIGGTTFNWTRDNTVSVTGIPGSGSGNISGTLNNNTTAPVTAPVTFTITPTANGCTGTPITATVIVNPVFSSCAITLTSGNNVQTVCRNSPIANITYNTTTATGATFSGLPSGVSGEWAGNVVTISGTPGTSGMFNYTVTLTGSGCNNVTVNGTINVTPENTAGAASSTPSLCINTTLNNITHATTGATGIANNGVSGANGLPAGVSAVWASGVITISGTPTVAGTFNYTIPLTGGCGTVSATGSITVKVIPNAVATPSSQTIASGAAISPVVLSGSVGGTSFNWTRDNTVTITGIAASGSGNINGTLTNTTSAAVTVTFTVTPTANGCTGTPVTATVIVGPGSASCVVTCPANIIKNNAEDKCGANVFYPPATSNCAGTLSYSKASGSFFPVGVTTVTVTSPTGANCSFTITVKDVEKPEIGSSECGEDEDELEDIEVGTSATSCNAVVNFMLHATDNCAVASLTSVPSSGSVFPLGTTIVTVTATDPSGNSRTATFKVKVKDKTKPIITCPTNITQNATTGLCKALVNVGTATATDNCTASASIIITGSRDDDKPLNDYYPVGLTKITWKAKDAAGNKSTCVQRITVIDNQAPVISGVSASPSILWPADHTMKTVTVNYSVTDNCSGNITTQLSVTSNEPISGTGPGDLAPDWQIINNHTVKLRAERSPSGTGRVYTITITAKDGPGNTSIQTTTVLVPLNIATQPVITAPTNNALATGLKVDVSPNPSSGDFRIQVTSNSKEPVTVRIMDITGVIKNVYLLNAKTNNTVLVGTNLPGGTYTAEIIQGNNRRIIKLVKLN